MRHIIEEGGRTLTVMPIYSSARGQSVILAIKNGDTENRIHLDKYELSALLKVLTNL